MSTLFNKFLSTLTPTVRANDDEELVDPQQTLREECGSSHHCAELKEKLQTCNDRVNSKSQTAELCTEELFDFLHCVDHCVTPELFKRLK